jgi:hypothetical protein
MGSHKVGKTPWKSATESGDKKISLTARIYNYSQVKVDIELAGAIIGSVLITNPDKLPKGSVLMMFLTDTSDKPKQLLFDNSTYVLS